MCLGLAAEKWNLTTWHNLHKVIFLKGKNMNNLDCGVYVIRNVNNNKVYVGSSIRIKTRIKQHKHHLKSGEHHSLWLQRSWNKHGEDSFEFTVILFCSKKDVLFYEQRAIDGMDAHRSKGGYNMYPTAGSCAGIKRTQAEREKMKLRNIGRIPWNKGVPQLEAQRKAHSIIMTGRPAWNKGIPRTEEQIQALVKINKGRPAWNKGIPCPDAQKKIQSEKMMGKPSPNKGKVCPNRGGAITEEQKMKISKANKGRKFPSIVRSRKAVITATHWAVKQGREFSYLT
jgi:group I intron endonuclease